MNMSNHNNFFITDDIDTFINQTECMEEDNIVVDDTSQNAADVCSSINQTTNNTSNHRQRVPLKNDEFYEVTIPSMEPDDFRYHFRMSRSCFESIMSRIANKIRVFNLEKKLLFTIWMLSTRESFAAVGSRFCLSKGSSHQYFIDIMDGLIVLFKEYVAWPTENDFFNIQQGFRPRTGGYVPGIIGAISSCHFLIKKPARYSIYCNPRQSHSIILQAVCDHQKIFTDVYVGAPGCLPVERVYDNSPLSKEIANLIPEDSHMVGNMYYPLRKNLLVPFTDEHILTENQKLFNECLAIANATIEQALVLLVSRFRRLTFLDTLNPEMANKMVVSSIILHNHILMNDVDNDDENLFLQDIPDIYLNGDPEEIATSPDDPEGLIKRNYLLSLFGFI